VGANHCIVATKVQVPYDGMIIMDIQCPIIYRSQADVFNPLAGYLYTQVIGTVTKWLDANRFKLDNSIIVNAPQHTWIIEGTKVTCTGVAIGNEFVVNTVGQVYDY
jgi:hypothetical protein